MGAENSDAKTMDFSLDGEKHHIEFKAGKSKAHQRVLATCNSIGFDKFRELATDEDSALGEALAKDELEIPDEEAMLESWAEDDLNENHLLEIENAFVKD